MARNNWTPIVSTPDGSPQNVPLNITIANRLATKSVTATWSSQSFEVWTASQSLELISLISNSWVVYIKYGFGSAWTASSTDFDQVLNPWDRVQVWYTQDITHISYIGSWSDVVKLIER